MYKSQFHLLQMWKYSRIQLGSCLNKLTAYQNLPANGSWIQNTVITSNSSQHRVTGSSSNTSWKFEGHSNIGPCGCQEYIQLLYITFSHSIMTSLIIWMPFGEVYLRSRLNGRKTNTSPWSLHDRSSPISSLKSLPRWLCFSWQYKWLILSGSHDHIESGTREWLWILRMRVLTAPNTKRHF